MIKKTETKTGTSCRVTFKLTKDEAEKAERVALLGDFNGWSGEANLLTPRKNGDFSATLSLDAGKEYRFRYLADGERWLNDGEADELVPNRFGSYDCVITV